MSAVHQKSSGRKAPIHQLETDDNEEFEINGEIFKLELHNGKRTPVKQNKPASEFRGKCFKCERKGHMSRNCTFKTKANGAALNEKKKISRIS